ncbi:hypothetical protein ZWY2020_043456 [Hordeum vulgare]|nr:hypothetical protein ZWY2020_043456 [Hordeum vulgare]
MVASCTMQSESKARQGKGSTRGGVISSWPWPSPSQLPLWGMEEGQGEEHGLDSRLPHLGTDCRAFLNRELCFRRKAAPFREPLPWIGNAGTNHL